LKNDGIGVFGFMVFYQEMAISVRNVGMILRRLRAKEMDAGLSSLRFIGSYPGSLVRMEKGSGCLVS